MRLYCSTTYFKKATPPQFAQKIVADRLSSGLDELTEDELAAAAIARKENSVADEPQAAPAGEASGSFRLAGQPPAAPREHLMSRAPSARRPKKKNYRNTQRRQEVKAHLMLYFST